MNVKILAVLVTMLVAIGFSGVASAATQNVLVKEAWDEQVLVTPAWNETIVVQEAYDEQVEVSPAHQDTVPYSNITFNNVDEWFNWIMGISGSQGGWGSWNPQYETVHHEAITHVVHHEAVYETIHHEAVYEDQVVIDVPGQDAYDEEVSVEADHNGYTLNSNGQEMKKKHNPSYNANWFSNGYVKNGFKVVDDTGCGVNHKWVPVYNIEIIHHEAIPPVTHIESVLIEEAWDEQVLVSEAYDETVVDQEAYDEQVLVNYLVSGEYVVNVPAEFETVHHEAVTETIEHPAVFETVHHPAEYITVEIPDPVVPIVPEVVEPNTVPMEKTGLPLAPLVAGLLVVIGGLAISIKK